MYGIVFLSPPTIRGSFGLLEFHKDLLLKRGQFQLQLRTSSNGSGIFQRSGRSFIDDTKREIQERLRLRELARLLLLVEIIFLFLNSKFNRCLHMKPLFKHK